jgi:hypothetical protein
MLVQSRVHFEASVLLGWMDDLVTDGIVSSVYVSASS